LKANVRTISPSVNFHCASALAAVDAAIVKIDTLNCPSFTREVDYTDTGSFGKAMTDFHLIFLIVREGYYHIRYFDRGVFNSDLKLPKPAFAAPDLDPIMIASKVYFPFAQA
jgi:hypothetical protein